MTSTTAHRPQHITFAPSPAESLRQSTLKKNMTVTQTYYLAHKARSKLGREAARADHNLRLLVGHANLLDNLMIELADAERDQERWFNQSVRGASTTQDRHVQFSGERIVEEDSSDDELYEDDDSSDEDEDYEEIDFGMISAPRAPTITTREVHSDDVEEDDLEEDYAQLELVRTSSHSNITSPPPELVDESDSSDDEAGMPPSPTNAVLPMPAGKAEESLFADDQHYLPGRTPLDSVTAVSVY